MLLVHSAKGDDRRTLTIAMSSYNMSSATFVVKVRYCDVPLRSLDCKIKLLGARRIFFRGTVEKENIAIVILR
jgi:hypothetical protein